MHFVLVPDAVASLVNFHDIVLEDLRATPESRARRIVPAVSPFSGDAGQWFCLPPCASVSLIWRPSAGCAGKVRRRHTPMGGQVFCDEFVVGALDRHMMTHHLALGQLSRVALGQLSRVA